MIIPYLKLSNLLADEISFQKTHPELVRMAKASFSDTRTVVPNGAPTSSPQPLSHCCGMYI